MTWLLRAIALDIATKSNWQALYLGKEGTFQVFTAAEGACQHCSATP